MHPELYTKKSSKVDGAERIELVESRFLHSEYNISFSEELRTNNNGLFILGEIKPCFQDKGLPSFRLRWDSGVSHSSERDELDIDAYYGEQKIKNFAFNKSHKTEKISESRRIFRIDLSFEGKLIFQGDVHVYGLKKRLCCKTGVFRLTGGAANIRVVNLKKDN